MEAPDSNVLRPFTKYLWWKTPDDALKHPRRIAAQVMDLGDFADVLDLIERVGEDYLRQVLEHAEAGQFRPRSWHYWHYRLRIANSPEQIPPLPVRRVK